MRKITRDAVQAFFNGTEFSRGNTMVKCCAATESTNLLLHGHSIAKLCVNTGIVSIRHAGYTTNTTKERLNGVLARLGDSPIYQRDYIWYWGDGEQFPDDWAVAGFHYTPDF